MLSYKGYDAVVEFDEQARLFHGEVLQLRDVVTFQGTSVDELVAAFHESVDDYLDFCEQEGVEPDKPFTGNLMLRLPPHIHRKVYTNSKLEGKSINQWIVDQLAS